MINLQLEIMLHIASAIVAYWIFSKANPKWKNVHWITAHNIEHYCVEILAEMCNIKCSLVITQHYNTIMHVVNLIRNIKKSTLSRRSESLTKIEVVLSLWKI